MGIAQSDKKIRGRQPSFDKGRIRQSRAEKERYSYRGEGKKMKEKRNEIDEKQ